MTLEPIHSDSCLAFQIEGQDIKGRIIRLGATVQDVMTRHSYPDAVNAELGQAMALTALLGSMMKFDGIITLQLKSDGRIKSLVSDFATDGSGAGVIRGYSAVNDAVPADAPLLGDGHLVITMDQGQHMDRYQGIVPLRGHSLKQSAEDYFHNSEQLLTSVMMSCGRGADGGWTAGAIMIQHLARSSSAEKNAPRAEEDTKDQWNTAKILLSSVRAAELLDRELSLQELLRRLYHESGVRVFGATAVRGGCRCSDAKLRSVLAGFSTAELQDMARDGVITMTCEFCMTEHKFELKKLIN